jgi:hypothetical protein
MPPSENNFGKRYKGNLLPGYDNIFEGRITRDYRFFFLIETDT